MKLFVYLLAAVFCQDVTVITTVAEVTIVQPTTTQDAIGVLTTMVELATTQAAPGSATPVVGSGTGNGRGNGAGDRPSSAFGSKLPSPLVAFFIVLMA